MPRGNSNWRLPFSEVNQRTYVSSLTKKAVLSQYVKPNTIKTCTQYIFKSPYWGKTVNAFRVGQTCKIKLLDDPNPNDGMRFLMLGRILSYLTLRDILVSSREGQSIVNPALRNFSIDFYEQYPLRMRPKQRQNYNMALTRAWENAQKSRVKTNYMQPEIRMKLTDPAIDVSNKWVKKYATKLLDLKAQPPD